MNFYKKSLISFFIVCMIIINLLSLTAFAEDTRTEIPEIVATSDISSLAVYGGEIKAATFNVTKGSPAYFNTGMGDWWKKDGDTWVRVNSGYFSSGTWRYATQIRIDGKAGSEYILSSNPTVKVDGNTWTTDKRWWGDNYSCINATGVEINIVAGSELVFSKINNYDVPNNYVGQAIKSFSVANTADGGTKPYTFSKTSGPDWINVSSDGTISGTPTTIGNNPKLVVRVTDKSSNYKEITIYVGITTVSFDDKTQVSKLEAASDIKEIATYGGEVKTPTFTVTSGSPAYFNTKTMGDWWKKNGDSWERVASGNFTTGTWKYATQVRIDGDSGYTHRFAKDLSVNVDGDEWTTGTSMTSDTYSCNNASFEMNIDENTIYHKVKFNTNGSYNIASQNILHGNTATRPNPNPGKRGCVFDGWYSDPELTQEFDFSTPITSDITIYAKWIELDVTVINEISFSSSTTKAMVGSLPEFNVVSNTEHISVENYGANTKWARNSGTNKTSWITLSNPPTAEENSNHYGLRLRVLLDTGYTFYDDVKIYFNGKDITDGALTYFDNTKNYSWGAYLYIDLEQATNKYDVTFNLDGGTMTSETVQKVEKGETATKPNPNPTSNEGWNFVDWYLNPSSTMNINSYYNFSTPITEDIELTAVYSGGIKIRSTMGKIAINAADRELEYISTDFMYWYLLKTYNDKVKIGAQAPDGYRFVKWVDQNGETFSTDDMIVFSAPRGDLDLTAVFEPDQFTVTFNSNGHGTNPVSQVISRGGMPQNPAEPTEKGYVFRGWYTEPECLNEYTGVPIVEDITLYAKWENLPFTDIDINKWYIDSVTYVYKNNIMTGYNATTFAPDNTITRGQIATMLYRLAGQPDTTGLPNPFTDVPAGKYYTEPVKWALSKGITTGKTATIFDPDGPVTRQELAVFMARYSKEILGNDITSTYDITGIADYGDLSTWAIEPMKYIMEKGVITGDMKLGYPRILPRNNATRAESATMFMRFCKTILNMP